MNNLPIRGAMKVSGTPQNPLDSKAELTYSVDTTGPIMIVIIKGDGHEEETVEIGVAELLSNNHFTRAVEEILGRAMDNRNRMFLRGVLDDAGLDSNVLRDLEE